MKYLIPFLLIAQVSFSSAQEQHQVPKDKWTKALYLSDEFCATKGLKPVETNGVLRAWSDASKGKLTRVVDIRLYFSSPEEAASYLKKNLAELSENGEVLTTKIDIPQAANLMVLREGAGVRSMNAALGVKINMYYFVFTVKNYLAKVFVSSQNPISVNEVAPYAKEAARRLTEALH